MHFVYRLHKLLIHSKRHRSDQCERSPWTQRRHRLTKMAQVSCGHLLPTELCVQVSCGRQTPYGHWILCSLVVVLSRQVECQRRLSGSPSLY